MTPEEIAAWEADLLADHNLTDLADCVQLLRTLSWSVALSLQPPLPPRQAFIWFEDLDAFAPLIAELRERAGAAECAGQCAMLGAFVRLYHILHEALAAGPRKPGEDEVVRRYVRGEIGDRTARYVMGWESHQDLIDACLRRNLPPLAGAGAEED